MHFIYIFITLTSISLGQMMTPVDIFYSSEENIAGFQFSVDNVEIISASGGAAEANGFMVSTGNNTVLGFSLTGSFIPAGSGVLTTLEVNGSDPCIGYIILSGEGANVLDAEIQECLTILCTSPVLGCTDETACNYNQDADTNDGSCEYPEEHHDCEGNCISEIDCLGECGGNAVIDECGICDGSGIPIGHCDCNGNIFDCNWVCGGSAELDECGVCEGDGSSCLVVTLSFGSITDNSLEIWMENPIEVAGFQFMLSGLDINGASGGAAEENNFMVSTSSNTVIGFSLSGDVIPMGNSLLTQLSFSNITGDDICLSNAVISSDDGDAIDYEVGNCLSPSDYFNGGCTDEEACNYTENLEYDNGSCTYPEENFDCEGNCLLEYDCSGICGGNSEVDTCGVCNGTGPEENHDCEGNCIVELDCEGNCGGMQSFDECGVCGGDGSTCDNPEATISFGDLGGDILVTVQYADPSGEICLINPILSDPLGGGISTLTGFCISTEENWGAIDIYYNSSVDVAGFQFGLTNVTITGITGGLAYDAGFTISNSSETIVGFSLSGISLSANGVVGCFDLNACNYNPEANINGVCHYYFDCAGICGGQSELDSCGICNGPGAQIECWDGEIVCNQNDCSEEPVFEDVDYLTDIQPVFNANCTYYCHTNGGVYQGGLDLTSYDNLMAGNSDNGPVVIPGDSDNSILIQKLSDNPPFGAQMPNYNPPLDPETIALIAAWIDEGALPGDDDGSTPQIYGCTNPIAENYNPEATIDDGSCIYPPLGNLSFGYYDTENWTIDINLDCEYPVSDFQFDITGLCDLETYAQVAGGAAENAGFTINLVGNTIIGSSNGKYIPAHSGHLLTVDFGCHDDLEICFENSTITTYAGIEYEAILSDCIPFEDNSGSDNSGGDGSSDGGGFCDNGYVEDCSGDGDCCPDSWIGDGYGDCEDQAFGCDLTCYDNDGGDCADEGDGSTGGGSEICNECVYDFSVFGSECCDTAWEEFGESCTDLEAIYGWDCYGCNCPGDSEPEDEVTLTINIAPGWNWFSLNVEADMSLQNVMSSLNSTEGDFIKSASASATYYPDFGWYGGLEELGVTGMYKFQSAVEDVLEFSGIPINPAATPIPLSPGWNWIGFTPQYDGPINDALASALTNPGDFIKNQSASATYYSDFGWYGGMEVMGPNEGYMFSVAESSELIYPDFEPDDALTRKSTVRILPEVISHWNINPHAFEFNGTITLSIEGNPDAEGDYIAAFAGEELRGVTERIYFPFGDSYMYSLMVYSNTEEGEKLTFKHYNSFTGKIDLYQESIEFSSDMIVGDGFNMFKLSRKVNNSIPDSYGITEAYPNPFNPVTHFSYSIPEDGFVQLSIFDINGRKMQELVNQWQSAGIYPVEWNATDFSSGVYIIKMISNDVLSTQKIALIK